MFITLVSSLVGMEFEQEHNAYKCAKQLLHAAKRVTTVPNEDHTAASYHLFAMYSHCDVYVPNSGHPHLVALPCEMVAR
jgi:hypothetical protein